MIKVVGKKTKMEGTLLQLTEDYINASQHYLSLLGKMIEDKEVRQDIFRECNECAVAGNVGRDAEVERLSASIFYRMVNELGGEEFKEDEIVL